MSDRKHLLEHLLDPNQVVVFDGAMGTMLYSKGVFINQNYDELDLRAGRLARKVAHDLELRLERGFPAGDEAPQLGLLVGREHSDEPPGLAAVVDRMEGVEPPVPG